MARIPPGMHVQFDDPGPPIPQAIQQSLANFEGAKQDNCLHGASLIAQNSNSTAYVVKNGLIRVLPKTSGTGNRILLRHHSGDTVTDVVFFHATSDVLATVSHTKLIMWKFETVLLEIQSQSPLQRVVWHPLDLNQFWILDSSRRAVLVDSTNLRTEPDPVHGYNVAQIPENCITIPDVLDLCWHSGSVATISAGALLVWKERPHLTLLHKVPVSGAPLQRCLSVGSNRVVTLQEDGTLTVWETGGTSLRVQQVVQLTAAAPNYDSLLLSSTTVEPGLVDSPHLILCSRSVGKIYVLEFAEGSIKNINIVESAQPCYAISAARSLPTLHSDDANGLDIEFAAYHPKAVQTITVPWTLLQQQHQQDILLRPLPSSTEDLVFDDYEVDDDVDVADQNVSSDEPPPSSQLPSIQNNPFANWLGAIAAKNAPPTAPPAATTPTVQPPSFFMEAPRNVPVAPSGPTFLSPMDFNTARSPAPPSVIPAPPPHPKEAPTIPTPPPPQQKRKDKTPPPLPASEAPPPPVAAVPPFDETSLTDKIRLLVQEELRSIVLPKLPSNKKPIKGPSPPTKEEMETMVVSAQADTVKRVLIPAVESITAQVLEKVSVHLEQQQKRSDNNKNQLESMSKQLSKMTALVSELTKEVQNLRNTKPNGQSPDQQQPPPPPKVDTTEAERQSIRKLLSSGKYQEAFVAALHSGADMTLFCCRTADIKSVLGGEPPALAQPILLCVMQQLGTTLINGSTIPGAELEWLQELVLSLDVSDVAVQQHGQQVVQEVLGYLVQRQQRQEPALKRPLQRLLQIFRGLQVG